MNHEPRPLVDGGGYLLRTPLARYTLMALLAIPDRDRRPAKMIMGIVLARNLALALSTTAVTEISQPVSMAGANAVQPSFVAIYLSGTGAAESCQLQESNDLENWSDVGSATSVSSVGKTLGTAITAVKSAYVRMKYSGSTSSGTGNAVLAA